MLVAGKVLQHKFTDSRGADQRADRPAPARQRRARRRHQGDAARGLASARHLCVRARRSRARRCSRHDGEGADQGGRRDLEEARARSADQIAGRTGDARLDRREGDRQGGRAPARRRRLHQPAAEAHEAAIRPDDRLRAGVRQGHARPFDHQGRTAAGDALQHLYHRRPAARADLQSRQGGDGGGRQSRCAPRDLFFVADGTGGHAFAETLDQHQKNVARWRQIEKDAKDRLAPDATPAGPPPKVHGEARSRRNRGARRHRRPSRSPRLHAVRRRARPPAGEGGRFPSRRAQS